MAAAVVRDDDRLGAEIGTAHRVVGAQHALHHHVELAAADEPVEIAPGRRPRDRAGPARLVGILRDRRARQVGAADVGRRHQRRARRARARAIDRLVDGEHDGAVAGMRPRGRSSLRRANDPPAGKAGTSAAHAAGSFATSSMLKVAVVGSTKTVSRAPRAVAHSPSGWNSLWRPNGATMMGVASRRPRISTLVSIAVMSLRMRGRRRNRRHAAMLSWSVSSSSAPAAANA